MEWTVQENDTMNNNKTNTIAGMTSFDLTNKPVNIPSFKLS